MGKPTSPDLCLIVHRLRSKKVYAKARTLEELAATTGLHLNTVRSILRGTDPVTGLSFTKRKLGRPRITKLDGGQLFRQVLGNERDLTVTEVAAALNEEGTKVS